MIQGIKTVDHTLFYRAHGLLNSVAERSKTTIIPDWQVLQVSIYRWVSQGSDSALGDLINYFNAHADDQEKKQFEALVKQAKSTCDPNGGMGRSGNAPKCICATKKRAR